MLGDPEKINGENRWESNESIISQVVNISREIGANVEEQDKSVANRLPSGPKGSQPIINCLSRRIGKISLRNNKSLARM